MKKALIIISLSFILISLFSFSLVYAESNNTTNQTYPCGQGTDNQACPCISQPVPIPNCTIIPKYSSNGCLSSYETKCNQTINCYEDNDCGTSTETRYCYGSNACTNTTTPICNNPGTVSSKCSKIGGGTCGMCSYGCQDGACIKSEQIKEQVKCIFANSESEQKCYLAEYNDKFFCSGIESCVMDVSGYIGEKMIWKSSCGGYAYTTITGENKYAKFDCSVSGCMSQQCEDGSWQKCYQENRYCTCSTCPSIIIKPVCGNGICESGEGMICMTQPQPIVCEAGKECKTQQSPCKIVCLEDCNNLPGIYAKLNEKFKLQVNQPVKITDYKNMKITFRDLLTPKCEAGVTTSSEVKSKLTAYAIAEEIPTPTETPSSSGGGGTSIIKCPNAGPMAQLEIEMPETEGRKILTLKLNEVKNVYDVSIVFLAYDYASRTGAFIINSQISTCPVNCKCDDNGNVIVCYAPPPGCGPGTILCPDGECRETCTSIDITDCNYGCIYNNKCLPIGTRAKGLYCSIDGSLSNQLTSDESCENNFECKSNVCVDGKCISSGLLQKIISWFKKIFGGGREKYTCPEEKFFNCMPVPVDLEKGNTTENLSSKNYCSGEYHEWILKNCDTNFVY